MEKARKEERTQREEKRERGRPPKEDKKLCRSINLKLTEDDFKAIAQKAASVGMKPTQYARRMVLNRSIKSRETVTIPASAIKDMVEGSGRIKRLRPEPGAQARTDRNGNAVDVSTDIPDTLVEIGVVLVERPEQCFVLVADTLIGVTHHLGGDEVLPLTDLVVEFDNPRLDLVEGVVNLLGLVALTFGAIALCIPQGQRGTICLQLN